MDALEICNKLRSEASGVATSGIPLDIFPQKMQQMILDLARTENYSIEFTVTSLISAMAAAVGNSCYIRIKGNWITSPIICHSCWQTRSRQDSTIELCLQTVARH